MLDLSNPSVAVDAAIEAIIEGAVPAFQPPTPTQPIPEVIALETLAPPVPVVEPVAEAPKRKRKTKTEVPPTTDTTPAPTFEPWPKVTHTSAEKLPYTLGIELTAQPPTLTKSLMSSSRSSFSGDQGQSLVRRYAEIVQILLRHKKFGVHEVHQDQYAVEVSSDILKTWGEVKKFYDTVAGVMEEAGLQPHIESTISGGGHLHIGSVKPRVIANVLRDLQNRPYLNWVMNDPDDQTTDTYAAPLSDVSEEMKEVARKINVNPAVLIDGRMSGPAQAALLYYGNLDYVDRKWFPDEKRRMVRFAYEHKTLEFRFLQTPLNWEEQEAHIRFVYAYLAWVEKTYKDKDAVVDLDTPAKVKAMTQETAGRKFKEFLTELGLPFEPYKRMFEDNLKDRFARGTRK